MKPTRDQLIFKALCALEETCSAMADGPVAPTAQLRFLLAFLCQASGPDELGQPHRASFDEFWSVATRPCAADHEGDRQMRVRRNQASACMQGIARRVGMPLDREVYAAMARALRGRPPSATAEHDASWALFQQQIANPKREGA